MPVQIIPFWLPKFPLQFQSDTILFTFYPKLWVVLCVVKHLPCFDLKGADAVFPTVCTKGKELKCFGILWDEKHHLNVKRTLNRK